MTRKAVKVQFVGSNLASFEHFNTQSQLIVYRMADALRGIVDLVNLGKGGVFHSDYMKLTSTGLTLHIAPGIGLVRLTGGEYAIIISEDTLNIDLSTSLSDGSTLSPDKEYDIWLRYREDTDSDIVNINPVSGLTSNALVVSVVDASSAQINSFGMAEGYSVYFREVGASLPTPGDGFIYLGRVYIGGTELIIEKQPRLIPPRTVFLDDDPDNRTGMTITPSVEPYTDLNNFLACKGHAPRSTSNPFGIAYEDVGGPRDYYLYFTVSGIIQMPSNAYKTYQPSIDVSYPQYVKIRNEQTGDYLVAKGVKSSIPPQLYAPPEFPTIFIEESTNPNPAADYSTWKYVRLPGIVYDNEVWMLAIEYNETEDKFYLRWVSGTPDSPVYNQPLLGSNDLNDFLGKLSFNPDIQLSSLGEVKQFIESDRFIPILLVGRRREYSTVKIGVFYESEDWGVQFNNGGAPGDLRKFHFLPLDFVRWDTSGYNTAIADSLKLYLRKSAGEIIRWHISLTDTDSNFRHVTTEIDSAAVSYPEQGSDSSLDKQNKVHLEQHPDLSDFMDLRNQTNSEGKTYLHHADRIVRRSGFEYLYDSDSEKDVEGALNALVLANKKLLSLYTIEFFLGETEAESQANWNEAISKLNSLPDNNAYPVIFTLSPHPNNKIFTLPNTTSISYGGWVIFRNLGVKIQTSGVATINTASSIVLENWSLSGGTLELNSTEYFRELVIRGVSRLQQNSGRLVTNDKFLYIIFENTGGWTADITGRSLASAEKPYLFIIDSDHIRITSTTGEKFFSELKVINSGPVISIQDIAPVHKAEFVNSKLIDSFVAYWRLPSIDYVFSNLTIVNSEVNIQYHEDCCVLKVGRLIIAGGSFVSFQANMSLSVPSLIETNWVTISGSGISFNFRNSDTLFKMYDTSHVSNISGSSINLHYTGGGTLANFYMQATGFKLVFVGNDVSISGIGNLNFVDANTIPNNDSDRRKVNWLP